MLQLYKCSAAALLLALLASAPASADVWDRYKRIRQGERGVEPPAAGADQAPATPAAPSAVNPAAKQSGSADQAAAPSTDQRSSGRPDSRSSALAFSAAPAVPDWGDRRATAQPVQAPAAPDERGNWWAFYSGILAVAERPFYGPYGRDFHWAYARKEPLPEQPRIVVRMHGSGGGKASMGVFAPATVGDIEVRTQDAEVHGQKWREWWTVGADGQPYPGRRIAATLEFLVQRYDIDTGARGIVLLGRSMGGVGAVAQTMLLPAPWRERIAYSTARIGALLPRRIAAVRPGQYRSLPPATAANKALWDSFDFSLQAARDPVVRGMHYRHMFSSNDQFSAGPDGNTQLEFVNLVEKNRIGGAFAWVQGGHGSHERGLHMPDVFAFAVPEQDVTLDRAHPAITASSGNYPRTPEERVDAARFPRGHYNLGITWDHGRIVDEASQLVFPLKYRRHTDFGKGVPDQPERITVDVTPRRPRHFSLRDGETLHWSWDGGALSGTAQVQGDTLTVADVPLVSGENYKLLRIYR